jgi:hypothetical protein
MLEARARYQVEKYTLVKLKSNPIHGPQLLSINSTEKTNAAIDIYNVPGQVVLQQSFNNSKQQLVNVSLLPEDAYFITVRSASIGS